MGLAPSAGKVFFPLDRELALLPGNIAPRQQEHVVHLACWMPFDKAANMVERLLGVQTNEETVRCLSERIGKWMEDAQKDEMENEKQGKQYPKEHLKRCAFSTDGAMIPLVKKQWAETRTLAIGEPIEKRTAAGKRELHVMHLSYFSCLCDASTFTDLTGVEMRRRGVSEAKHACAVTDGADWCQTFTDMHRHDAQRILDFPHASEHVHRLLDALEHAGLHFPDKMLQRSLHVLKHRGPRPLLRMADRLGDVLAQKEGVREHLGYLRKREAMMQYHQFQRDGWPIGSGMVESANKNNVEARLKGTGMRWERKNVNPMLALRNAVCNDRWQEMWQKAYQHYDLQESLRRQKMTEQRAEARRVANEASCASSPPQPSLSEESPSQPVPLKASPPVPLHPPQPAATLPGSSRPSSHHPWKRGPACRPRAV